MATYPIQRGPTGAARGEVITAGHVRAVYANERYSRANATQVLWASLGPVLDGLTETGEVYVHPHRDRLLVSAQVSGWSVGAEIEVTVGTESVVLSPTDNGPIAGVLEYDPGLPEDTYPIEVEVSDCDAIVSVSTGSGLDFAPIESSEITVSGGTLDVLGDGSTVITYAAPGGTLEYDGPGLSGVRALMVGGGGSGGLDTATRGAGGGGAGGVIDTTITLTTDTYPITVGAGADSKVKGSGSSQGDDGEDTEAFAEVAVGGGGGGASASGEAGRPGGSGGGGGGRGSINNAGGAGVAGQGNDGGAGRGNSDPATDVNRGGGGGGAGAPGQDWQPTASGAGGDGIASDITGTSILYGGGGGGSGGEDGPGEQGAGGAGGGGAGDRNANGQDGTDGLGGGGGAASGGSSVENGAGGDGVCIVRVPDTPGLTITVV